MWTGSGLVNARIQFEVDAQMGKGCSSARNIRSGLFVTLLVDTVIVRAGSRWQPIGCQRETSAFGLLW